MMNYDGLLSKLTDDKISLDEQNTTTNGSKFENIGSDDQMPTTSSVAAAAAAIQQKQQLQNYELNDVAIEEEQAAPIHNVPRTNVTTSTTIANNAKSVESSTTPQRKISASSRFMNVFSQFYSGNTNENTQTIPQNTNEETHDGSNGSGSIAAACRTPTKGMESRIASVWHNFKYGWSGKMRTSFSKEQPIWLLGRCYHRRYTPPVSMESSTELPGIDTTPDNATTAYDSIQPTNNLLYPILNPQNIDEIIVPQELGMDAAENQIAEYTWEEGVEGFRRDFFSRIWMTYRREFPVMNGTSYTSDCGWGCMLRSGQMLLAQALICHFLGRCWRFDAETQLHTTYEDNMHKRIIKWFGDSSSKSSPFSIHALVRLGLQLGKKPGDWYGPASVSYLLKHALENAAQENADFDNIAVYVATDCTIYIKDIEELCSIPAPPPKPNVPWQTRRRYETTATNAKTSEQQQQQQHWKSLIVLIPLRLGTEKLNPVYAHCLKLLLSTEYCVGVIGGRPKHSLYFVGFQEDKLIHLDPHFCQEMVDVNQENFPVQTFHCKSPRKIKINKMDPSCCIGFYCPTKTDFDSFMEGVQLYLHPMRCASGAAVDKTNINITCNTTAQAQAQHNDCIEMNNYPLFTFSRGRCLDHVRDEMSDSLYKPLQRQVEKLSQELGMSANDNCEHDNDSESEEFVLL